jgi:hypothetical protein
MPYRHNSFFASARAVAVLQFAGGDRDADGCGVAVLGFRHASQIQEQVQQQTLDDMTGSMNLARDTANVATAAVRLSQVVGALEYKSEAERLKATQMALQNRWSNWPAPLAQLEPQLVERITSRSNELEQSVTRCWSVVNVAILNVMRYSVRCIRTKVICAICRRLTCVMASPSAIPVYSAKWIGCSPPPFVPLAAPDDQQLTEIRAQLPDRTDNPVVNGILQDFNNELAKLGPLAAQLEESDLAISWYMFHIKALVAILNSDINQYVAQVAQASEQRTAQSHQ